MTQQQCRVEQDTNAYHAELERQERDEWKLAEAAQETLDKIDKIAADMMKGAVFLDEKKSGLGHTYCEHSLAESEYTCDEEFYAIERKFAARTDVLTAADDLWILQRKYCRQEAAIYLDADIYELEKSAALLKSNAA